VRRDRLEWIVIDDEDDYDCDKYNEDRQHHHHHHQHHHHHYNHHHYHPCPTNYKSEFLDYTLVTVSDSNLVVFR